MIGIISDTQIYSKGGDSNYLKNIINSLELFYEECKRRKVDKIVHIGDVFEIKNEISDEVLVHTSRFFTKLSKLVGKNNFFIVVGNHDTTRKDNSLNLLEVFSPIAKVINKPFKKDGLFFIPYYEDQIVIKKYLKNTKQDEIVFGHFGVNGAKYQKDKYTFGTETIVPNDFRKAKRVFLGHYHYHQTIAGNIHFVGSSWQCNFGEEGEEKGFIFYDENDDSYEFVENENYPKYITVEFESGIKNLLKIKNHFVKIIINSKISSEFKFRLREKMNKKNYNVKFDDQYNKNNSKIAVIEDWNKVNTKTPEQILDGYLENVFENKKFIEFEDFRLTKKDLRKGINI